MLYIQVFFERLLEILYGRTINESAGINDILDSLVNFFFNILVLTL